MTLNAQNFLEKIDGLLIIELLKNFAKHPQTKLSFDHLEPYKDFETLQKELDTTYELFKLLNLKENFPFHDFPDLTDIFKKLTIENTTLLGKEWLTLLKWLKTFRATQLYFLSEKQNAPFFFEQANKITYYPEWTKTIEQFIDPDGRVKSEASPKLLEIRTLYAQKTHTIRNKLQKILRYAKQQGWAEEVEITFRNDRWVIPIKADFKGKIKGFIHDISHSGFTIFLEPTEILDLNNELRELEIQEQNEIFNLLLELTNQFRKHFFDFQDINEFLLLTDKYHAKVRLAQLLDAERPYLSEDRSLSISNARNPILILKKVSQIVPLSIQLNEEHRILLISGPNAGGKSVALKTIALLTYMLHCGLLVPCDPQSHFPFTDNIFVTMGDDQSLANDLSTYTSHLQQLKNMLLNMTEKSLFIIDELGSGTDPLVGGAIAEAFLEQFALSEAFGIVSTHFSNLKLFAEQHPNILNAAMMFDQQNLIPTYQLLQGVPGSSYAIDIAKKVGIPQHILQNAQNKIGQQNTNLEQLYLQLKTQYAELQQQLHQAQQQNAQLHLLIQQNEKIHLQLQKERKNLEKDVKKQAYFELEAGIKQLKKLIKQAQKHANDLPKLKEIKQQLEEEEKQLANDLKELQQDEQPQTQNIQWAVGMKAQWNSQIGEIIELNSDTVTLLLEGNIKLQTKTAQLKPITTQAPTTSQATLKTSHNTLHNSLELSAELNLIGMRVDEALKKLDKYLETVMLSSLNQFRIIHGTGTGALKMAVRQFLKKYPDITVSDEHPDYGGPNITVCSLKNT